MATTTADPKKESVRNPAANSYAERAATAVHQTIDKLAAHATNAEKSLRSTATQSREQMNAQRLRLQDEMETNMARARLFIAKNPLAAAGIAFAAGMVITALARRGK